MKDIVISFTIRSNNILLMEKSRAVTRDEFKGWLCFNGLQTGLFCETKTFL